MLPINPIQLLCFYSILIFAGHGYLIHGLQVQPLGIIIGYKKVITGVNNNYTISPKKYPSNVP